MITILDNKDNNVYYKCSCGALGRCMFKKTGAEAVVITIKCLQCETTLPVTLSNPQSISTNGFLSWVPIIQNELLGE